MKITKLGHCCLLIETRGKRILTDPGSYTVEAQSKLKDIDCVLFTHEHQDHCHIESLKIILKNNPQAIIYANDSVSELLNKENIKNITVKNGQAFSVGEVVVTGIGEKHAMMHSLIPISSNTGYFVDNLLWYPGDAFTDPKREVKILALPVSGPWMKIGDALDYAILIKPKVCFPVHDAIRFGSAHAFPAKILPTKGIEFIPMIEGDVKEF
ncbi:MAG: MBL fold metallo-hydrolase [Candidatus Paceibacterota bacterium]|jgi:L-ascorbate metabolism protein UlaG (beta-lactamase superfamily)